jgi:hypothetical protein
MTMRIGGILAAAVLIAAALPARAQETYPTPEAAAKDLVDSAKAKTPGFGDRILGKDGAALLRSGDTDQEFNEAAAALTAIDDGPNGTKILRVGKNGWTLPLPLIKTDAGWRFDVAKGKEEMTNRRVGYNELSAIEACKAYVAAQDEYFKLDRDGNGLREYARRIVSTPGTHDGLYWPPENQADISPLDGFAEDASLAGRSGEKPEPYDGYYFRILTAQGPSAPGGAFSYLINGHMIAGHALVAWPAAYGDSGVETFICGENGVVFQKDLGPNTAALGASMAQYNPDASWKVVE